MFRVMCEKEKAFEVKGYSVLLINNQESWQPSRAQERPLVQSEIRVFPLLNSYSELYIRNIHKLNIVLLGTR